MSKEDQEYVETLKFLILQINSNPANFRIQHLIFDAQNLCPSNEERIVLNELIDKAIEHRYLNQNVKGLNCTEDEYEKYYSLVRWFNNLNLYLIRFNTLLRLLPSIPE